MHRAEFPVKRPLVLVLVLAVLGCTADTLTASSEPASSEGKSVFLDPGHSGTSDGMITRQVPNGRNGTKDCQTTGTSADDGYPEHAFNWDVVLRIRDELESRGIHTQLSRSSDTDTGPCIDRRAAEANAMQPDAIVSIHADGARPSGHGFHVNYSYPPLNDAQSGPSIAFASTMRDSLQKDGLVPSNYIGADGLYGRSDLAGLNLYQYPAVLVELGNMRNRDDAAQMQNADGRTAYARAVTNGIVTYLTDVSIPK